MSTSTILEDISQALENWSHRILDVETKVKRVKDFRETIVADLHRKIEDGVISEQDSLEFEYITDLWQISTNRFFVVLLALILLIVT